jgi:hypothetical protein
MKEGRQGEKGEEGRGGRKEIPIQMRVICLHIVQLAFFSEKQNILPGRAKHQNIWKKRGLTVKL